MLQRQKGKEGERDRGREARQHATDKQPLELRVEKEKRIETKKCFKTPHNSKCTGILFGWLK